MKYVYLTVELSFFCSLFITTWSHTDFEKINLHVLFPNVQVILMRHFNMGCPECDYNPRMEDDAKVQDCLRLGRISFKQFTKLKIIQANVNSILSMGELLEFSFTRETLDTIPPEEELIRHNF